MRLEISGRGIALVLAGVAVGGILTAAIGYYGYVLPQRAKYEAALRSVIVEDFIPEGTPQAKDMLARAPVWEVLAEIGSDYRREQRWADETMGSLATCSARLTDQQSRAASQSATGYDLLNAWKPGLGTALQRMAQQPRH